MEVRELPKSILYNLGEGGGRVLMPLVNGEPVVKSGGETHGLHKYISKFRVGK